MRKSRHNIGKLLQQLVDRKYVTGLVIALGVLVIQLYINMPDELEQRRAAYRNAVKVLSLPSEEQDEISIASVKHFQETIKKYDSQQIRNLKKYGDLSPEDLIFVIEIRGWNKENLQSQIDCLKLVSNTMKILLIFAHVYFDEGMNTLIQGIEFARVLQIFYPYSDQLYPSQFPGPDRHFCAEQIHCKTIDYSNQRKASLSKIKHIWWWKINTIFDHLKVTQNYNGTILFLEDDDYIVEDIYHVTKLLEKTAKENCSECLFYNLNARLPIVMQYEADVRYANVESFMKQHYHTTGLAFNRTAWEKIKLHKTEFCHFNDYTWYNSLANLLLNIKDENNYVMYIEGPRLVKMTLLSVAYIEEFLHRMPLSFFPAKVEVKWMNYTEIAPTKGFWEDVRDQELCMFIANQ